MSLPGRPEGDLRGSRSEGVPPAASAAAPTIGASRWTALLASVAVAALGYLGFSLWGGWDDVVHAAGRVGGSGALVLLSLSGLNYALRFARWQIFLRALGSPQPWRPSLVIYLAGFALTTTPGKVGEAVRSLFLKARGVRHADSMAAFVSERLSDLLAVAVLCALGWNVYPPLRPLFLLGAALVGGAFLLVSRADLLARGQRSLARRPGRLARAGRLGLELLIGARRCHTPRVLGIATLLSLAAWSSEAFALHLLLRWLDVERSLSFSFFTYAIGMLAGALSFLPGGLGGTEATMTALLIWGGASHPVAIAATVFIRLTTLWFAVVVGLVALSRLLPSLRPAPSTSHTAGSVEAGRA